MKTYSKISTFLITLLLAVQMPSGASTVEGKAGAIALLEHSDVSAANGVSLVDNMISQVSNWQDYCCQSELQYYKGKSAHKSQCRFYFKSSQVRVEVTGGGYRDGTVLVRFKDGKVRARGGGLLGGITMNLDPSSRLLILPNGINLMWSDLPTVLTELKQELRNGATCQTSGPVTEGNAKLVVLDVFSGKNTGAPITKRIFVDANRKIPVRWDLYAGGKLLSSAYFKELKTNTGLNDQMFSL